MQHQHPSSEDPKPLDPAHEINARSVVTWVVAWSAILFAGLWLMLVVFARVWQDERVTKIELQESQELNDNRGKEADYLSGKWEKNFPRKSIEDVMREMAPPPRDPPK
jgi:hypothetical protein